MQKEDWENIRKVLDAFPALDADGRKRFLNQTEIAGKMRAEYGK